MVTYKFYVKKGADLTKYGFSTKYENDDYVYSRGVVRICVRKKDRSMRFNMPNNDDLKVFMDMVLDGVVVAEKWHRRDEKPLQVFVTEEEKEMLEKWRKKKKRKTKTGLPPLTKK